MKAIDLIKKKEEDSMVFRKIHYIPEDVVIRLMRDFAKFHVQEALKEALNSIPCLGSSSDIATYEEVEEAVLNSYSLDLIK